METKKLISFIIPVRDRDKSRITKCVKSLKSDITNEIIIIDYGSKIPLSNIPGARIIRYNKNKIWNKAHAINLGIREANGEYIGTVDCDMIIQPNFIEATKLYLNKKSFIYSINVRRIQPSKVSSDFKSMLKNSDTWLKEDERKSLVHNANGGVQIYPRDWIYNIGGVDEALIYWGAVDNDTFERAIVSGMSMINLNKVIFHQEHKNKKEQNLPENERHLALRIRIEKIKYLDEMFKSKKYVRNNNRWGHKVPNQKKFLKLKVLAENKRKMADKKAERYKNKFIKAVSNKAKSFIFNGEKVNIFTDNRKDVKK